MITFILFIYRLGMVNAKAGTQMQTPIPEFSIRSSRTPAVRLGYLRLLDAAPLIVADSMGMFLDVGLDVELSREVGWATLRDKLAFGDLDVAQALSPMPFFMQLGIGVTKTKIITGMVLNCNGNAITLSRDLHEEGVTDGDSLRRYVKSGFRPRKLVFGVVSLYSSHYSNLCRWLEQYQINPHRDVIITVLPPEHVVRNLASNNIDGFCVGEPWNSMAIEEGIGWCPATSAQISSGYPEKVLATTERFYSYRPDEYLRMIEVLHRACAMCDAPEQRVEILKILSKEKYLNCTPETLAHAFSDAFPMGYGRVANGSFLRFSGTGVNRPDRTRAKEVYADLSKYILKDGSTSAPQGMLSRVYREDIYDQAMSAVFT
ncbi:MAG: ABC-type nitrate/sulfonate/bicarbonate transport system substrate-binding protein [Bacteroidia bacterium]|jgi:ABC-type nitrate/sulfonate/bicarbonate transport system substrate-binding protein